jgi:hypothetical protein
MSMPFDMTGVTRGPDGIKRYDGLPASLVHMLRDTVERYPAREALAETGGGPRLTYRELWERPPRRVATFSRSTYTRDARRRMSPWFPACQAWPLSEGTSGVGAVNWGTRAVGRRESGGRYNARQC